MKSHAAAVVFVLVISLAVTLPFSSGGAEPAKSSSATKPVATVPPELPPLQAAHQQALSALTVERDERLAALRKTYTTALEDLLKRATARGDLDEALAVKKELERVAANRTVTESEKAGMPPRLAVQRAKFELDLREIPNGLLAKQESLRAEYVKKLEELQETVTRRGDLPGAMAVKAERVRGLAAPADKGAVGVVGTELAAVRERYREALQSVVDTHAKRLGDLKTEETAALEKLLQAATARGDLSGALAVRAEVERLQADQEASEPDKQSMPHWLLTQHNAYDRNRRLLYDEQAKNLNDVRLKHVANLEELQKQLTGRGELEAAAGVRVEKENALADLALFGPAGPTSVRELNTLRRQWEQSRKQLAQQTAERLAQAKDSYLAELDALRQQMVAQNRAEVVLAVKREQEDVRRDRETPGESAATLPIELRTIKLPHQQAGQQIRREQAERCHRMLESYRENLEFLAASLAARGATEAAALVRVEKICVRISGAAENQALRKTDRAGGDGGSEFYDVNSDGGLLVGVRVYHSESNGRQIVKGIQPVYLTPRGKVAGNAHGARSGTPLSLEAKDGYAVGALNLHSAQKVDGLEVVFMKINSSGSGLVAGDSYKSAWCGATGNAGLKHLGGDGKLVAGLHGSSGRELMAIGLVQVP